MTTNIAITKPAHGMGGKCDKPVSELALEESKKINASQLSHDRRTAAQEREKSRGRRSAAAHSAQIASKTKPTLRPRALPDYMPSLGVILFAIDLSLIGTLHVGVFGFIHERLALDMYTHAAAVISLSVLATLTVFYAFGCYQPYVLVNRTATLSRIPAAVVFSAGILFLTFHFGLAVVFPDAGVFASVSRCITIALLSTSISLSAAIIGRVLFFAMVHLHWFRRRILVIGAGQRATHLWQLLQEDTYGLLNELYFVSSTAVGGKPEAVSSEISDHVILSTDKSLDHVAHELATDEIVVALDEQRGLALDELLNCKMLGIPVTDYNTFLEREIGRLDLHALELSWLIYSSGFWTHGLNLLKKRCMDIFVSLTLLLISLPVLLAAMIAVWLEDRGQIFFRQERVTLNGNRFQLLKLRTMRPDAEKYGAQWAQENDPRITRVGKFLRRTRIDEIPQLLNVLRGDMSLVGPRPERPIFVDELSRNIPFYNLRHSVKAGITGWAQVSYQYGASQADAERKLEYDLYYIKNYNVRKDIAIILQTLRVLIWPPGVR